MAIEYADALRELHEQLEEHVRLLIEAEELSSDGYAATLIHRIDKLERPDTPRPVMPVSP
jgi:hypothetical protein